MQQHGCGRESEYKYLKFENAHIGLNAALRALGDMINVVFRQQQILLLCGACIGREGITIPQNQGQIASSLTKLKGTVCIFEFLLSRPSLFRLDPKASRGE